VNNKIFIFRDVSFKANAHVGDFTKMIEGMMHKLQLENK